MGIGLRKYFLGRLEKSGGRIDTPNYVVQSARHNGGKSGTNSSPCATLAIVNALHPVEELGRHPGLAAVLYATPLPPRFCHHSRTIGKRIINKTWRKAVSSVRKSNLCRNSRLQKQHKPELGKDVEGLRGRRNRALAAVRHTIIDHAPTIRLTTLEKKHQLKEQREWTVVSVDRYSTAPFLD